MDIIIITLGVILILTGIIGSFLPVIPGLPFSYAGLLMLQLTGTPPFSVMFLVYWAIIVVVVMSFESIIPAIGAKQFGGSRSGIIGCLIGAVLGFIFFPPLGIVIGPVIGAFAGEIYAGKTSELALKAAIGSFIGFFAGTVIKVVTALVIAYYFFTSI
jgi:uncharacterized protein